MDLSNLNEDQIKGLISLLQGLLPEDDDTPIINKKKKTTKTKKTTAKPKKINKFEQMSEFRMHKEDIAIDKKLAKFPPVPRTRQFEPLEVLCRVCGRKEKVNPALVESIERYKCNKCCSSNG
jgi:lysyl-tRNA synthetase class I